MSGKIGASAVGGLLAGLVFGLMMQMMTAPTPDGGQMPMIAMGIVIGHLIYGLILGGPSSSWVPMYPTFQPTSFGTPLPRSIKPSVESYLGQLWMAATTSLG